MPSDTGALAGLLPGGRPLTDPTARSQVAAAWGLDASALPGGPGVAGTALLEAAAAGSLAALLIGGVELSDYPDAALAVAAVEKTGFVVSLENHHSAVTERADVVLPVAVVRRSPAPSSTGRDVLDRSARCCATRSPWATPGCSR